MEKGLEGGESESGISAMGRKCTSGDDEMGRKGFKERNVRLL